MSRRVLWATLALSLLVTLALYAVRLAPLESVLTARGHGIVALELAGTGPRFTAVVQDWGSSLMTAQELGPKAQCLVDLGHHAPNVNIEMIVARLIRAGKLGEQP